MPRRLRRLRFTSQIVPHSSAFFRPERMSWGNERGIGGSWQFCRSRVWSDVYRHIYWRYCRAIKPAFEGLELLAWQLARAVLRGPGADDSLRLPGQSSILMSSVEVREAELGDANEIGSLICSLAEKFITHEFSYKARKHFLSSNNGESVAQNMKSGFSYFVATDSGQLVGVVGVKDNSHLYHLFVVEHYQGMGLARRLWGVAMDECKRKGNRGTFTVNSSNNATGVYEKLGFERTGPTDEKDGALFNPMEYRSDC